MFLAMSVFTSSIHSVASPLNDSALAGAPVNESEFYEKEISIQSYDCATGEVKISSVPNLLSAEEVEQGAVLEYPALPAALRPGCKHSDKGGGYCD
jgi:hypothetical protein